MLSVFSQGFLATLRCQRELKNSD